MGGGVNSSGTAMGSFMYVPTLHIWRKGEGLRPILLCDKDAKGGEGLYEILISIIPGLGFMFLRNSVSKQYFFDKDKHLFSKCSFLTDIFVS